MKKLGTLSVGGTNPVRIMGILNISPESFFKKSVKTTRQSISKTVKEMENQGADLIDVGGMSTAPYLKTLISEKTESNRINLAIKIIQNVSNLPISVDTCRAEVAKKALELGTEIINDISGLQFDKKMPKVVERFNPSVILCAYSKKPVRGDPVLTTKKLLRNSILIARSSSIPSNRIVLDPSIGFFREKGVGHFSTKIYSDWVKRDLTILQNLRKIKQGYPLMVSVSNKSFLGKILHRDDPSDRLSGSLTAEVFAVLKGADIIRTHNVKETKDAVTVAKRLWTDKSL